MPGNEENTVSQDDNNETLRRLRAIRGGHRGQLTRSEKDAKSLIRNYGEESDCTKDETICKLKAIAKNLQEKQGIIAKLDDEILHKCPIDDITGEVDESTDVSTRINEIVAKIDAFERKVRSNLMKEAIMQRNLGRTATPQGISVLNDQGQVGQASIPQGISAVNAQEHVSTPQGMPVLSSPRQANQVSTPQGIPLISRLNTSASSTSAQGVKLPKIQLPKFRGDVTKFQAFWQSFKVAVDENESLSMVHKLNYLINSLEGIAYKTLEGLEITEENYQKAVDLLKTRFGKSQQVISAHMRELLNMQMSSNEKANNLRALYDNIQVHVRGLESLGVSSKQYGSLLIPVIMSRMPSEITLQIARKTSQDVWEIDEIMDIILAEIEAREVSEKVRISEKGNDKLKPKFNMPAATTKAFVASTGSPKRSVSCFLCNKEHYASDCQEVTDTSKRIEILNSAKRCLCCLKVGHFAKNCRSTRKCKHCQGKHHAIVCLRANKEEDEHVSTSVNASALRRGTNVLLQTAQTYAFGENSNKKVPVNVLFDSGSQKSYIVERLMKILALKSEGTEQLNLNTFGSENYTKRVCNRVVLNLEIKHGFIPITALSHPAICSPVSSRIEVTRYPHLSGLELANSVHCSNQSIDVLIGADFYHHFVLGEVIRGEGGPVAVSSRLGWLLSGPVATNVNTSISENNIISNLVLDHFPSRERAIDETRDITASLKEFWKHESLGLIADDEVHEDKPSTRDVSKTKIEFDEEHKRYEVSLPWKDGIVESVSSDYEMCHNRLLSLYRKLKGNNELLNQYDAIFMDQLAKGIIERVPLEEEGANNAHFLCHFGVIRNDRKTTKLRVVFDGSAKSDPNSLSLNDRLEVGDNYMPLLFDTLLRFRVHKIAITADIEAAFLQIGVKESDRDVLRFLWFDDVTQEKPSIVQYRYCRLVFGLTCSPAILGETIRFHIAQYSSRNPEVVKILNRLYADDLSCGCETVDEALDIYRKAKGIMQEGGFNLRKWNSNSKDFLGQIMKSEDQAVAQEIAVGGISVHEDDESYTKYTVGNPCGGGASKVLGVNWNHEVDNFQLELLHVSECSKNLPPTKRSLLKLAAMIFDPLGFISVFTINLKAFFQELCLNKLSWDEPLEGSHRKSYDSLLNQLHKFSHVSVPRCFFDKHKEVRSIELHGFSDASERAYAAVVYLRIEYLSGEVDTKFITSKAKVAPIKRQSIPRLELLAACLLAKLGSNVQEILANELHSVIQIYYWIDSMPALCWIRNSKPWVQYVRHRVSEILKVSTRHQWFYCPGPQNPADLPSRGIHANLPGNSLWWEGPAFLKLQASQWPKSPSSGEIETVEAMQEKLKNEPVVTHAMVNSESCLPTGIGRIIDVNRYSDKNKVLRIIAWILRFVTNMKSVISKGQANNEIMINALEIENAETQLIKSIQSEAFQREIGYLTAKSKVNPPPYVNQFNLFLDENRVLRCRTRIRKASLSELSKEPIFLPSKHWYSELISKDCHDKVFHDGIRETLNMVRQKYWILRGRERVKGILRRCTLCKRLEGLPYSSTFCDNLPEFRVEEGPPFANVGIDFAGPLITTDKQESKSYVCLFTCASTRAVHLELVEALDVQSFIRAFRRFCARRGVPALILSDNAKTFKAASKEVKTLIRSPRIQDHFSARGVKWKFIVELAPWQGGMWERLIRSTKRCLIKQIGRAMLNYSELQTILTEVENVINSRPLTYIFDDQEGISYPLTPSQLINGRNLAMLPHEGYYEVISTYESLSRRANYNRKVLSQFSHRWKNEYLLNLLEAYRPKSSRKQPTINVGDVFILRNEHEKRVFWKMCRVIELLQGKDGIVRAAKVQVVSTDGKKKVLNRSLKHLIPLEIPVVCCSDTQNANPDPQRACDALVQAPAFVARRPKRNAAIIADMKRRDRS